MSNITINITNISVNNNILTNILYAGDTLTVTGNGFTQNSFLKLTE